MSGSRSRGLRQLLGSSFSRLSWRPHVDYHQSLRRKDDCGSEGERHQGLEGEAEGAARRAQPPWRVVKWRLEETIVSEGLDGAQPSCSSPSLKLQKRKRNSLTSCQAPFDSEAAFSKMAPAGAPDPTAATGRNQGHHVTKPIASMVMYPERTS